MKGFTKEHTIPAPPSAVFSALADVEQAKEWQPAVQEIRLLRDGKLEKGAKWVETRATKRGPVVSTVEVTEYEPERALAIRAESRKARIAVRFELEADGKGTKVRAHSQGRLKGLRFPFSGRLVKEMQEADGDILQRLEAQVAKRVKPASKATGAKGKPEAKAAKPKAAKAAKATQSATTGKTPKKGKPSA